MEEGSFLRFTQFSDARNECSSEAAASCHIPSWTKMWAGMCSAWLDSAATFA